MIELEAKRKQLRLSLKELGLGISSLNINPDDDYKITIKDAKRLADWAEGYKEDFI